MITKLLKLYLYGNCDYWQNNGHTARCSHKFHIKRKLIVKYIIAPYLNYISYFPYFSALKPPALKIPVIKPIICG